MAEKTKLWLTGFSASTIALLNLSGFMNGQGLAFYLITTVLGGGHLAWQLKNVNLNDPKSCWRMFKSNTWFGAIITFAICADAAWTYCLSQAYFNLCF
jgi:4-hydroxybenzoate polyprenyltransferase